MMDTTSAEPQSVAAGMAEDAAFYRLVLHELIEVGADMVRLLHIQTKQQTEAALLDPGPGEVEAVPDLTVAYDRVSRAMRRTIGLARTLSVPVVAPVARVAARRRIIREVEDAIQRSAKGDAAGGLQAELMERLDAPDLEDEIDGRPVADIIADICRDLGIMALPGSHPWKRRTPADVTALCARAASCGREAGPDDAAAGGSGATVREIGGVRASAKFVPEVVPEVVMGARSGSDPPGGAERR